MTDAPSNVIGISQRPKRAARPKSARLQAMARKRYIAGQASTGMLYVRRKADGRQLTFTTADKRKIANDLRTEWIAKYPRESLAEADVRYVVGWLEDQAERAGKDAPTAAEQAGDMVDQSPAAVSDAADAYYVADGCTWWKKPAPGGGSAPSMLATFTASISEEVTLDDGAERTLTWLLRVATRDGRAGEVRITPDQLGRPQAWAAKAAGTSALVMPGQAIADHLRVAVQARSDPERRTVYTHTGWRELDGRHVYLSASGALGAAGLDATVTVDLGTLAGYALPNPAETDETALREAIRTELDLLEVASDTVMVPALAATWRAPLPLPPDTGGWMLGPTGSYKTAVTALCQQHYGPAMDAQHLPGHWTGTGNALVAQAYMLDGTLYVVDDYSPDATAGDARRRADAVDRLFRGSANRAGRPRLRPDATLRPDRPPRAQVLTSAEDVPPAVESLIARAFIAEVRRGDVQVGRLTEAQAQASGGTYALAMAGYVRHLAARYDRDGELPQALAAARDRFRDEARADGQHPRTALNVGSLALGCASWLAYAHAVGAIDEEEQQRLWQRCQKALAEVGAQQQRYHRDGDPVRVYLRSLRALVASGHAHLALAAMAGGVPQDPSRWGWVDEKAGVKTSEWNLDVTPLWRPRGDLIGWVADDDVYLQPDAAYRAARQFAEAAGTRLGVSERMLRSMLRDRQMLADGGGADHQTVRRDLSGQRSRRVLHLTARVFAGEDGQ